LSGGGVVATFDGGANEDVCDGGPVGDDAGAFNGLNLNGSFCQPTNPPIHRFNECTIIETNGEERHTKSSLTIR
jgi:hypothetical protein